MARWGRTGAGLEGRPGAAEFGRGVLGMAPMLAGVAPLALALGAEASRKGIGVGHMALMAGLNFAGGSEFAAVGLWSASPDVLLIAGVTLLINSRHLLMGAVLAPHLRGRSAPGTCLALFWMVDESWALSVADVRRRGEGAPLSMPFFMGASLALYGIWIACTAAGDALGARVGDLAPYGLDMAAPAVFLVLLRGMWRGARASAPWLAAFAAAALTDAALPGAWYLAAGALSGIAVAALSAGRGR